MRRQHPARIWVGLLVAAVCFLPAPLAAQELTSQVPSLKWIPADASNYSSMLRNREQIEIIGKSKAWARLNSLPVVQMGWKKLRFGLRLHRP